jgi:hypothetical protein
VTADDKNKVMLRPTFGHHVAKSRLRSATRNRRQRNLAAVSHRQITTRYLHDMPGCHELHQIDATVIIVGHDGALAASRQHTVRRIEVARGDDVGQAGPEFSFALRHRR